MKCLSFAGVATWAGSKRVRAASFEHRSQLPVSAACVVANGVRERFGQLYGVPLHVRLFEPVIPSAPGWAVIAKDAVLYRIRGKRSDAMAVLRPRDAVALASFAFGENASDERPLSTMERSVLERAVRALAATCAPVCGFSEEAAIERASELSGFVTFIEIQIERPIRARLGIALSRDPAPEANAQVSVEDLLDVQLDLTVATDAVSLTAEAVAALELGTIVPITKDKVLRGSVMLAGRRLAGGECGAQDGRFAIAIGLPENGERSPWAAL